MLQQLDGSLHFPRRAPGGEETGLSMIEPIQSQRKPFFLRADPEAQEGSAALDQRKRFLNSDISIDFVTIGCWNTRVLSETSLTMIADKCFLFTEPVFSPFAVLAIPAKNERINHYAVTRIKSFNTISDFIHLAIDLMAKDSGGLGIVDFSRIDMGIGSAHSTTEHFDPHLPEKRFGNRKILNLDKPWRLENCSLHYFSLSFLAELRFKPD